ncbi:MAG: helix-turn-helix domain-containing protein [Pyrinomonadaceae bacterium]
MSFEITKTVWSTEYSSGPTQQLVLLALADRADADGICWPSIADIARRTKLAERSVWNALDRLKKDKVVTCTVQSKGRSSNRYQINLQLLRDWKSATQQDVHSSTRQDVRPNPATGAHSTRQDVRPNPAPRANESTRNHSTESISEPRRSKFESASERNVRNIKAGMAKIYAITRPGNDRADGATDNEGAARRLSTETKQLSVGTPQAEPEKIISSTDEKSASFSEAEINELLTRCESADPEFKNGNDGYLILARRLQTYSIEEVGRAVKRFSEGQLPSSICNKPLKTILSAEYYFPLLKEAPAVDQA